MDNKTFNEIIDERIKLSRDGLVKKAEEYAGPVDRLHNFKRAGDGRGTNRSVALAGMMNKHTVSVYDMIDSGKAYPEEVWDEKIGDHLNYLLLLRATIVEDGLVRSSAPQTQAESRASLFEQYAEMSGSETDETEAEYLQRRDKYVETGSDRYFLINPPKGSELDKGFERRLADLPGKPYSVGKTEYVHPLEVQNYLGGKKTVFLSEAEAGLISLRNKLSTLSESNEDDLKYVLAKRERDLV